MMYVKILKEVNMKRISRIIAFMLAAVLVALVAVPSEAQVLRFRTEPTLKTVMANM